MILDHHRKGKIMGKISDALEKAGKESAQTAASRKPIVINTKTSSNVVTLVGEPSENTSSKIDPLLITHHFPDSIESDAFKVLRTNLLFPKKGKVPRTILVTSSVPGEGKSFISSNLAVGLAQGVEEHVVLIDCDLRKLDIPKRFGLRTVPGLSNYLINGTPLENLLLKTSIEKLTILSGGTKQRNPTELLSSKKMADLITEMKNRYHDRYIIIDSPPPSVAPETIAVSNYVDGIIFVIKEKGVSRKIIKETIELLGRDKIIGIVFNYSKRKRNKYYYGYNKYGKYGEAEK